LFRLDSVNLDKRVWRTTGKLTGKLTEYSQPDPHEQLLLDTCAVIPALAMTNDDSMVHLNLLNLQPEGDKYYLHFTQVATHRYHAFNQFRPDPRQLGLCNSHPNPDH